jgi:hypothetical protein
MKNLIGKLIHNCGGGVYGKRVEGNNLICDCYGMELTIQLSRLAFVGSENYFEVWAF